MKKNLSHYFLACFLILIIFLIFHVMHFRFLKPDVVLKACIIDVVISCPVGFFIYSIILKNDSFVSFSAAMTMVLGLSIYSILVPAMVDRSLSVYMLVYLDESGYESLTINELKRRLINDSIVKKRIEDHIRAGTIEIRGDKIIITKKGRIASKIFMYNRDLLDLKRNF